MTQHRFTKKILIKKYNIGDLLICLQLHTYVGISLPKISLLILLCGVSLSEKTAISISFLPIRDLS